MGEALGLVGPAVNLASKAFSGGGGGGGQQVGLTPQEVALAEYTKGQQILKNNSMFASSGTGMSTNKAFENAGAELGAAESIAGISDAASATNFQNNQSALNQLAQSAGFSQGFGSTGGSFGNTGGTSGSGDTTNQTTNTTG